ncbi:interleukin 17-like protein [Haliotis rubra]|uniref:interleukin 17-like protein n=1 Tax=Haliotis rubra TaxID=36100 RepID=UPI001EE5EDC8|nr:interleukin 17-like protein [Haliotis rubra]
MTLLQSTVMILLTVCFLIAMPQSSAWATGRRTRRCREPVNRKLDTQDLLHDSFYQIPPLLDTVANLSSVQEEFVNLRYMLLAGEPQCPTWEEAVRLHGGKVCPFHYVLNYDENRIPNTVVETECNCVECLRPDNGPSSLMDCLPIIYYTKVFRRTGCVEGVYRYAAIWEPLKIGCQCAHAPSRFTENVRTRSRP